ncbi:glycerophosphodiester phosphodiesterase family protein [Flavisolibacter ginsenosidimutans]|nr:glycerophosphodiester phosphodiesterase family protein [Flavisolibacter ginsenosidimutans]
MQTFDREGHRGCRGLMPENTIAAMKKAVDLNVTTLEMDAVMTKDGEVILSHEPFFNHEITTKPDGSFVKEEEEKSLNIYRMTYDEVKRYDVGLKPHPRFPQQEKTAAVKPLLRDLIDSIRLYCKEKNRPFPQWNIETKTQPQTDNLYHPAPAAFVEMLMKVIKEKGIEKNVIIQSFDFRTLQYLHQHYPHMRTAMLVEDYDKRTLDELLAALGFTPTIFSPAQSLVAKELVEACHQKKMQVIPWTVNETDEMQKLIALNVDGIITDYPNLFSQLAL